jgi:lysozyme
MDINAFAAHLEWAEDRRRFPYEDSVGKVTIGCGRNLDDVGLSDDEIDYLMQNDIARTLADAERLPYWDALDDVRRLIVADMIFNMGAKRFAGFVRTNAALAAGDYQSAADEMTDSKWYRQTGRRARKLVEAMRSGEWERS